MDKYTKNTMKTTMQNWQIYKEYHLQSWKPKCRKGKYTKNAILSHENQMQNGQIYKRTISSVMKTTRAQLVSLGAALGQVVWTADAAKQLTVVNGETCPKNTIFSHENHMEESEGHTLSELRSYSGVLTLRQVLRTTDTSAGMNTSKCHLQSRKPQWHTRWA